MGAARDSEDPGMTDRFDDAEPTYAVCTTAHLPDELQLHGYRPFADEPDPRPLPDPDRVNLFHRGIDRIGRELDTNETAQQRSQPLALCFTFQATGS